MNILSVSPGRNVNKGLAEDWQSPLPYQIDLLKSAARLKAHAADMQQRRDLARQKQAQDWWDDFKPNMDGLTGEQTNIVSNMYNGYLDRYAGWINAGQIPDQRAFVMADRNNIVKNTERFKAFNSEVGSLKEFMGTAEGKFMNPEKMYPLIYEHVQLGPDGNMRMDIRTGEVFNFANDDPRAIQVWDEDMLWSQFATKYKDERKDYAYGQVINAGEYESPYAINTSYVGPSIWDENLRQRGQFKLKDEVIQSIRDDHDGYLNKKINYLLSEGDGRTYEQIATDMAVRQSTGQTQITRMDEMSTSSGRTGDPKVEEGQFMWLNDFYKHSMTGDKDMLDLDLEQISSTYEGGVKFEYIPKGATAEFPSSTRVKADGEPVKFAVEGPAYIPIATKALQESIDLGGRMVMANYNYQTASGLSEKKLTRGEMYIPEEFIQVPLEGLSDVEKQRMAMKNTIKAARLNNMGSPIKERFPTQMLKRWQREVEGSGDVNLFQPSGTMDWANPVVPQDTVITN